MTSQPLTFSARVRAKWMALRELVQDSNKLAG